MIQRDALLRDLDDLRPQVPAGPAREKFDRVVSQLTALLETEALDRMQRKAALALGPAGNRAKTQTTLANILTFATPEGLDEARLRTGARQPLEAIARAVRRSRDRVCELLYEHIRELAKDINGDFDVVLDELKVRHDLAPELLTAALRGIFVHHSARACRSLGRRPRNHRPIRV